MAEVAEHLAQPARLIDRLRTGDQHALARALSVVESAGVEARTFLRQVHKAQQDAMGQRGRVIGFTGPPGSGKSTLINAYIRALREADRTVAALAVDPSSHKSGGAILGDRARMGEHATDPGVFIRSLAARGHLGGLTLNIHALINVVDAAGWDTIVLETVGTGQSEIEIARVADVTVVISAPGLGDEVQAMKAGILEIADVLVVNKADLAGAARTEQQLTAMLQLREGEKQAVPVVRTIATKGEGLADLTSAIDALAAKVTTEDRARRARSHAAELIAEAAAERVRTLCLDQGGASFEDLSARVLSGELDSRDAALLALVALGFGEPSCGEAET